MDELIKATGHVVLTHKRPGRKDQVLEGSNLVVNAGYDLMAQRLVGNSPNPPSHLACGDGGSIAALDQTALIGSQLERIAATVTRVGRTVTLSGTFGAGISTNVVLREIGIFNAASAGTMFARFTFPEINFALDSTLDVVWTITIGDI